MKYEVHQCDSMPKLGVCVQDHGKDAAIPDWVLSIFREAKEEDLEENTFWKCWARPFGKQR